jgi:hypothetical protein
VSLSSALGTKPPILLIYEDLLLEIVLKIKYILTFGKSTSAQIEGLENTHISLIIQEFQLRLGQLFV